MLIALVSLVPASRRDAAESDTETGFTAEVQSAQRIIISLRLGVLSVSAVNYPILLRT